MTENEFKLCCIVFYDNFKGKNLQEVISSTDSWNPVDVVIDSVMFNETYQLHLHQNPHHCFGLHFLP